LTINRTLTAGDVGHTTFGRPSTDPPPTIVLEPAGRWPGIGFAELRRYRGLFFFLVWRDIKVRYAQTVLGALWAVLQPVLTMVVFTLVFGGLAEIETGALPYAVFSLCGLVPWTYFSTSLTGASNSLVSNSALVTKIYIPRLIIPSAPILAGVVDFLIALVVLLGMLLAYGIVPPPSALYTVPLLLTLAMATVAGVGYWLSALNIQYRDIKYVAPFLVQLWMYAAPVVYPLSLVPEQYRLAYSVNPMVSVVEGMRLALTGDGVLLPSHVVASVSMAAVLLVSGALFFRRAERVFADVV
jgi:lipopolysaccharide transport system permease protein